MLKQSCILIACLIVVGALDQGTIHIQNQGGGQIESKQILFNQTFKTAPQVAIALLYSPYDVFAEVHDVTPEGFTLQMMATQQLKAEFSYIAIEDGENYQFECFNRLGVESEIQFPLVIARPTFIGVLATNTHANNFNIDMLDGNLIVDNDGQLNMCIIVTSEDEPIQLIGYQNYEAQELAEFHPFKKSNAMSLVQAQQSLEITHLDQHKSFEVWHHHSIEIMKDQSVEVYPTHKSLEIVKEEDHSNEILPDQFQQSESLEIFQVPEDITESSQKLISEDINMENVVIPSDDIKFDENAKSDKSIVKLEDQKVDDVKQEDIKLEDIKLENDIETENIKLDDSNVQEDATAEKVIVEEDNVNLNENTTIAENNKFDEPAQEIEKDAQLENIKLTDDLKLAAQEVNSEDIQSSQSQSEDVKLDNFETDKNTQELEDIKLDDVQENSVTKSTNQSELEDINLDNTSVEAIKLEDIRVEQSAQIIGEEGKDLKGNKEQQENNDSQESKDVQDKGDVEVHADEIKIENIKIQEQNVEDVKVDEQAEDQLEVVKIDDVQQDPQVFSEPQQKVTIIPDDDSGKVEEIDEMLKAAQQLKEEVQELKKKSKFDQFDGKAIIKEKAKELEEEVDKFEEPQVVEDQVSFDVNTGYEQSETVQEQELQEQAPIIYLNDDGVNPDQQLITQDVKQDVKQDGLQNNLSIQDEQNQSSEQAEIQPIDSQIQSQEQEEALQQEQMQSEVNQELYEQEQVVEQQQQEVDATDDITFDKIEVMDALKLDDDHQESEVFESGEVESLADEPVVEDIVENVKLEEAPTLEDQQPQIDEQAQEQPNDGSFEIELTTDEGEAFVRKPKKSDFLREKQRLKDTLNNVIRDLRLDSVDTTSLDSVTNDEKQYSLIVDRLDVPENNENVIVIKDEDYQENQEPEPEKEVQYLGDYVEAIEPSVENVNFVYEDEVIQEQLPIEVEDVKLDDQAVDDDTETNYTVVEAREDEQETLQAVDQPEQELVSAEVIVSEQDLDQEQEISLDEFQKELDELANTIGAIKQESPSEKRQSDYIVVNDNSQIYEATYDEQSYDTQQQDQDAQVVQEDQEDQSQYYQGEDQVEQSENQDNVEDQQEMEQPNSQQEQQELENQQPQEQQEQQQEVQEQQPKVSDENSEIDNGLDEQIVPEQSYDDVEPQEQYLTIDNLVTDNSSSEDQSEQPPQYYDEPEQPQQQEIPQQSSTLETDYDMQSDDQQENNDQQANDDQQTNNDQQEDQQDFVVMKAGDIQSENQSDQQQSSDETIEPEQQVEQVEQNDQQSEQNEIDIIVDVANQDDIQQSTESDYDYGDDFSDQSVVTQSVAAKPIQAATPAKSISQPTEKIQSVAQPVQPAEQSKRSKSKIQHSITISHNQNAMDRSLHLQHQEELPNEEVNPEEMKKDLKEQLKQELKAELKQELQQEMQQEKEQIRKSSHSLIVEEKVDKDPQRPAQKAINNFNDLLHNMVDSTLKQGENDNYHKLPIVDVSKDAFKNVEPKIEEGIDDLKKALGLKGGVEVTGPDGQKQVINVEDLKRDSEKLLTQPNKEAKNDDSKYEEYLKKVTEKPNSSAAESYEEQHNIRKQEILENIKRELEIKKGRFTAPNETPQGNKQFFMKELSPYEFERVYLDWEKNKQDIIPSMLQHSIEQPATPTEVPEVLQQKSDRVSKKEEVDKEVQELLFGSQKNKKTQSKLKEFRVEDLKYIKDDPLLDTTYNGFMQVKTNLRRRKN